MSSARGFLLAVASIGAEVPLVQRLHSGELAATRVKPLDCSNSAEINSHVVASRDSNTSHGLEAHVIVTSKSARKRPGQTPKSVHGQTPGALGMFACAVRVFIDGRAVLLSQNCSDSTEVMSDGHN